MKTFVIIMLSLFIVSCRNMEHKEEKVSHDFKQRSISIADGRSYQIVTYKGHEYLCNGSTGGIIHTESCECNENL